jgi:polar amino acid transport system permease protein
MATFDLRPTVRRRMSAGLWYVVAVGAIIWIGVNANWDMLATQFANPEVALQLWPTVVTIAMANTIWYTLVSFTVGTVFATILALMKMSSGPPRWFAIGFIELFRGLPAILTLIAFGYVIPIAFDGAKIPGGAVGAGLVGLTIVTAAYSAEVIRAGIDAVPKGQREAAASLGMSENTTNLWIILPQAFRIVLPPLTNEFVTLLKDTSLLYVLGTTVSTRELTAFSRSWLNATANGTPLVVTAICYLIITIPLTWLAARMEKKYAVKK